MNIDGTSGVSSVEKVSVERPVQQQRVSKQVEAKPVQAKSVDVAKEQVVPGVEEPVAVINDEMLNKAVEAANKTLAKHNNFIERSVHDVTKTVMYVMKDTETDEVIREFPPKKIQDMIAKMWELAGLFVDEKA